MAHSPAFTPPHPLCNAVPCRTRPSTCTTTLPISMAKRRRSRSKRPSKSRSSRATGVPTSEQQQQQQSLVDHFEEDVNTPLSAKRASSQSRSQSRNLDLLASFKNFSLPARNDALNLLVKGAWVGIGILVGTFIVVHFVIVKDFLPK